MKTMKTTMMLTAILAMAASFGAQAANTITFAAEATTGNGHLVPHLTWSSSVGAQQCVATGGWTGSKVSSGDEVLPEITAPTTYNLTCTFPTDGTATARWTAPTNNTDGTAYVDAVGYRLLYGTSPGNLSTQISVTPASTLSKLVTNLAQGTWYFAITAVNSQGIQSDRSPTVSKVIADQNVVASIGITINPQPLPPTNVTVD